MTMIKYQPALRNLLPSWETPPFSLHFPVLLKPLLCQQTEHFQINFRLTSRLFCRTICSAAPRALRETAGFLTCERLKIRSGLPGKTGVIQKALTWKAAVITGSIFHLWRVSVVKFGFEIFPFVFLVNHLNVLHRL